MNPGSKKCTDPDGGCNMMEGGEDPGTEKKKPPEFVPSTLLSLK